MPDPDRLLRTLASANEAIQRQPGRRGRFIQLQDATEILAAGDLHGHIGNFQTIYKAADLAKNPRRHLILQEVVHSKYRYPLGGDKSHQLLDLFAALKNQFPSRVHLLMGNHELAQWTDRPIIKGDEDLNEIFEKGIEEAYGERMPEVYAAYKNLFAVLPLAIRTVNRVFVSHSLSSAKNAESFSLNLLEQAAHSPKDFAPKGGIYSLVWGRDVSAGNVTAFLKNVDCDWLISGHIPFETGYATPNQQQIILDCCGSPAAYALLPADRMLSKEELIAGVHLI